MRLFPREIGDIVSWMREIGSAASAMAQITVQPDLAQRLEARAAQHDRSAEAELRAILEEALRPSSPDFWQKAAALREATRGRYATEGSVLIREDRDRDSRE
jgi:plasmid stability protein